MDEQKPDEKLYAIFEFTSTGQIKSIKLIAKSKKGQTTIEEAMYRLFKPDHFSWIRRMFRK